MLLAVVMLDVESAHATETAVLEAKVGQRLVLDDPLVRSLPAITVDVTFETGSGKVSRRYTGALL